MSNDAMASKLRPLLKMPPKRLAECLLDSPVKTRRSARLWLLADTYSHSETVSPAKIEVKQELTEAKVKVEYEENVLSGGAVSTFYSQIGSNIFQPVSPKHVTAKQPRDWDLIYNEIVKMRALISTPVDSFGCERLPNSITPGMSATDPKTYRFQLLISLMLSAQTKDETNFAAMKTLQEHFVGKGHPGICLDAVISSTEAEIDMCIAKVGFHRRKALYIKKSCDILKERFGGEIPKTIEEIVTLPGVGPKMGHLILQNGWSINSGIGVDVHLHRLAQMWGWVPKSEKPELTRTTLEDWLPKQYWADINPLLVGFGQTVCAPKANNCDVCSLANGLCKGVNRKLVNAKLTEARLKKLSKQRGDLSGLVKRKFEQDAGW
ncbi:DNA glycosylase [Metschnikowia bicuspidata var. bicuspidata NRRL YB-4993]|uniref:Endonuclease III homolog n=1 Tax=Metschnikowia bicuspidata var. bicuspidata NRRL YB-4993 TaxID=869754 RepID=A0A1A0HF49_9ASCO|nr:DNA glycosylase [Metschnikowia bicuspidata var. bicuspidata NRRL YB-4993]OBA22759.1 DNA glycosylase [Metschnikowia bicuspidata var. bicuspidata NRRL YB-4993]